MRDFFLRSRTSTNAVLIPALSNKDA
jgi:hypothetical protein